MSRIPRGSTTSTLAKPARHRRSLSIVIPVFNESRHIVKTIQEAAAVAAGSRFNTDFVVVDDGSTDGSGDLAESLANEIRVRVIRQTNKGRVAARRAGLSAAAGDYTMFLDSRVHLKAEGLAFVRQRIDKGERVWNCHITIHTAGNPFGKFWKVLVGLFWSDYLAEPRTMSFGTADFDRYPKGTGGFIGPTELLKQAFARFPSYYEDDRYANDDTSIIRWIASTEPINISPQYAGIYYPRTTLRAFVRHAFHRGIFFLDGHGRPESRFFPAAVAFYPVSLVLIPLVIWRPRLAVAAAASGVVALAGVLGLRGVPLDEAVSFAALSPLYAVAHGAGMWRGLAMVVGRRLRQASR